MRLKRAMFALGVMSIMLGGCAAAGDRAMEGAYMETITPGLVMSPWTSGQEAGWETARNDAAMGTPGRSYGDRVVLITRSTRDHQYITNGRPRDNYRTYSREREYRRVWIR